MISFGLERRIRVADVDISFRTDKVYCFLDGLFMPAKGVPSAQVIINTFKRMERIGDTLYFNEYRESVLLEGSKLYWNMGDDRVRFRVMDLEQYNFTKLAGHLAGMVSGNYVMCHGAGINIDGRGIVLFGNSGNGKSSLATIMEGEVLSDDLIMISQNDMRTIGTKRLITDEEKDTWTGILKYESPLQYMFCLNKLEDPDYIRRIDATDTEARNQMAKAAFDDKNFPELFSSHMRRMESFRWPANVFEVGTKREPLETKKAIEYTLSTTKLAVQ